MKLLLCTNGMSHTNYALTIGQQLALGIAQAVDILVVDEKADGGDSRLVEAATKAAEAAGHELQAADIPVTLHHQTGQMASSVVQQAQDVQYDLVVVGSRGRSGIIRLLFGSVAKEVATHVPTSLLVIKGRARKFKRMLICTAAGPTSDQPVRFGGRLAGSLRLSVTLLHVMSQLTMRMSFSLGNEPEETAEADELGWHEGEHLQKMLRLLANQGVKARALVRQGLVIDEILTEAQEGRYDVIVVGAHIAPGVSSFLVEDFAKNVLLSANRPVLIVRQTEEE
jgi:nucleotide-binding universal stress UspA family protein